MSKPLEYEYVKKYFEDRGCILLSKEYVHCQAKMDYICQCGNESAINFNNFSNGKRCKECGKRKNLGINHHAYKADRERHEKDIKFRNRHRYTLINYLRTPITKPGNKTLKALGYTKAELKTHLDKCKEKAGNPENSTIDHIFPVEAFRKYNIDDDRVVNSLENLQVLSKSDNSTKYLDYDHDKFSSWLLSKGYNIYNGYTNEYCI